MTANSSSAFFVRNEDGRGFKPTKRGIALLIGLDVTSWILAGLFIWSLISETKMPLWFFVFVGVFAALPFCFGMFLSGKGPIGTLVYGARRMRGGNE